MNIILNGTAYELPQPVTVSKLVEILALSPTQVAIEVNRAIVPRSHYEKFMVNADDAVEIVTFIGGG
jgi:sulfur carrier protein